MDAPRNVHIKDFLTAEEIRICRTIYSAIENKADYNKWCVDDIIAPNLERINQALGQENDARFLAYAVEYTLMHETKTRSKRHGQRPETPRRWR